MKVKVMMMMMRVCGKGALQYVMSPGSFPIEGDDRQNPAIWISPTYHHLQ